MAASGGYGTWGGRSFPDDNVQQPQAPYGPDGMRPVAVEHSILRGGSITRSSGSRQRAKVNILELILVPWLILVLILVSYLLAGSNGKNSVLWIVPIVMISLAGIFINWHYKAGNNAEVVLGLLCITAVLIGLIVGVYTHFKALREYHRLTLGASYFNVLPSEPAAGHSDATTFVFTNATLVDQSRVYGFVDVYSTLATQYCVAPISAGEEGTKTRVQYWAAGTDCCSPRSDFKCGEANNANAHGAIVLPEDTQASWGFKSAVDGAENAYGVKTGEQYILVTWTKDPVGHRDNLWNSTVILFLIFGGVYLAISVMIGCSLMPVIGVK